MAAALELSSPNHNDIPIGSRLQDPYPRQMPITELGLKDTRYPSMGAPTHSSQPSATSSRTIPDQQMVVDSPNDNWMDYSGRPYSGAWLSGEIAGEARESIPQIQSQSLGGFLPAQSHMPEGAEAYTLPPVTSTYSPYSEGPEVRLQPNRLVENTQDTPRQRKRPSTGNSRDLDMGQRVSGLDQFRENVTANLAASSPRHPSLPATGISAGPSPIVPLSAGPSYNPTPMPVAISPKPRAYAQQPTYSTAPNPINAGYAAPQMQKEICVECAMRDQDMADVDVTSPGIWERDSDVLYEDLLQREIEDEAAGIIVEDTPSRPRARGGKLTEENLKLWLSVNPKEPSSRQQTLDNFVRAQRALLEAEAQAHARAVRESRQLDDRMRDAYSQLRRSAYEHGNSAQPIDDIGGVRIKPPRSTSIPAGHISSHSREVTLLENGMIVEHVDVRREEREERERRKKEEKRERSRARKTSRSSRGGDVMSIYSLQAPVHTDSGFFSGIKGSDSRYSQSISARPSSVLTSGAERSQTLLRAQSQASFSDMQSVGSTSSPRRSRFFGFKNLSSAWRSQDSFAPSGSMIDMHVALSREQHYLQSIPPLPPLDPNQRPATVYTGEPWHRGERIMDQVQATDARSVKKPKGIKKIWKLVTGSGNKGDGDAVGRPHARSLDRYDDDGPLAPPPPLSSLVRGERGPSSRRHVSTPSLPSTASPNTLSPYPNSPPTAPSSLIPSPTSSRRSTNDKDNTHEVRKASEARTEPEGSFVSDYQSAVDGDGHGRTHQVGTGTRTLTSLHESATSSIPAVPPLPTQTPSQASTLRRDKSLPPLPGESTVEFPNYNVNTDSRPQTMFAYDSSVNRLAPPRAPFRTMEARRQSFGGLGSRPASQTLPSKNMMPPNVPTFLADDNYGEFGMSRMPLGQWAGGQPTSNSQLPLTDKPKKRKSKFGLTSLFGKKSQNEEPPIDPLDLATMSMRSRPGSRYDSMYVNGDHAGPIPTVNSMNSYTPRMSIMSKKNIEELVEQDPEFVAYRYPSTEQRLDLV